MADDTDPQEATPADVIQGKDDAATSAPHDTTDVPTTSQHGQEDGLENGSVGKDSTQGGTADHSDPETPPRDAVNVTPTEQDGRRGSCAGSPDVTVSTCPSPSGHSDGKPETAHDVVVPVDVSGVKATPAALRDPPDRKSAHASTSGSRLKRKLGRGSTYGGQKARPSSARPVKVEDRDPHQINGELTLRFDEIFAEPESSVHSIDCVWKTSERVFSAVKLWSYRVVGIFCAVPCACVWGVTFALLSITSIWVWSPWLKTFRVLMLCVKKMLDYLALAFFVPLFEAVGRIFSSVRVNVNSHSGEQSISSYTHD